jgi:hypothetical protein
MVASGNALLFFVRMALLRRDLTQVEHFEGSHQKKAKHSRSNNVQACKQTIHRCLVLSFCIHSHTRHLILSGLSPSRHSRDKGAESFIEGAFKK